MWVEVVLVVLLLVLGVSAALSTPNIPPATRDYSEE